MKQFTPSWQKTRVPSPYANSTSLEGRKDQLGTLQLDSEMALYEWRGAPAWF